MTISRMKTDSSWVGVKEIKLGQTDLKFLIKVKLKLISIGLTFKSGIIFNQA